MNIRRVHCVDIHDTTLAGRAVNSVDFDLYIMRLLHATEYEDQRFVSTQNALRPLALECLNLEIPLTQP